MNLTSKELSAIEDELSCEQNLISKYQNYAETCTDTELKAKYEDTVTRHRKHYDALFSLINA